MITGDIKSKEVQHDPRKVIAEQEQSGASRAGYGQELIKELSRRLGGEFGIGFSIANLWNFRLFFLTYPEEQKLYTLRSELGWSHYRLIMRVDDEDARSYYVNEVAEHGWIALLQPGSLPSNPIT